MGPLSISSTPVSSSGKMRRMASLKSWISPERFKGFLVAGAPRRRCPASENTGACTLPPLVVHRKISSTFCRIQFSQKYWCLSPLVGSSINSKKITYFDHFFWPFWTYFWPSFSIPQDKWPIYAHHPYETHRDATAWPSLFRMPLCPGITDTLSLKLLLLLLAAVVKSFSQYCSFIFGLEKNVHTW